MTFQEDFIGNLDVINNGKEPISPTQKFSFEFGYKPIPHIFEGDSNPKGNTKVSSDYTMFNFMPFSRDTRGCGLG